MASCKKAYVIWGLALLAIPLWAYYRLVYPLRNQYFYLLREQEKRTVELMDLRESIQEKEAYLRRFAHHFQFRQHVLRERLGYAEPDEIVYLFEDQTQ